MTPDVKTTSGVVSGIDDRGVCAFLGLPYANAPLGEHRFRAPTRVDPWDGTRPCDAYGASAPQPDRGLTIIPEPVIPGDNCLNLNVFSPDVGDGAGGLPVLVWIHGGGFTGGCNASPWYHGRGFGRDGVVVVAVNYRLGIEGFLALDGAPTNRAVREWVLALEWVQDNIAAFGGDPGNVTIGGQSAGSVACATLVTLARARAMFKRAILMSGGLRFMRTLDDSRAFAGLVAGELGLAPTRDAFSNVDPTRLVELQGLRFPRDDNAASDPRPRAVRQLAGIWKPGRFGPVIDDDVIIEDPFTALAAGAARDVDVLVGTTAGEAERLVPDEVDDETAMAALEATGLSASEAAAYRAAHADASPRRLLGRVRTDVLFRLPAMRIAEAHAASAPGRTFAYEFQWKSPAGLGSVHCLDLPYVWDVLDADGVEPVAGHAPPQQLADDMHAAWVRFIRTGDPGWAPYSVGDRKVMAFDAPASKITDDPHAVGRTAFDRLA